MVAPRSDTLPPPLAARAQSQAPARAPHASRRRSPTKEARVILGDSAKSLVPERRLAIRPVAANLGYDSPSKQQALASPPIRQAALAAIRPMLAPKGASGMRSNNFDGRIRAPRLQCSP